jgi:hypothetical protein
MTNAEVQEYPPHSLHANQIFPIMRPLMTDGKAQEYPLQSLIAHQILPIRWPLKTEGEAQEYPTHSLHAAGDVLNKLASHDRWRGTGVPTA